MIHLGLAPSTFLSKLVPDAKKQRADRQLLKVRRTRSLLSHVTAGCLHPPLSSASFLPRGLTVRVQPQASPSLPGPWLPPAMALLGALVCCLLAAWHGCPALGLPLAPAGGPRPAPAVGESPATLSLPGAARERRAEAPAQRQAKRAGPRGAPTPAAPRGGRGRQGDLSAKSLAGPRGRGSPAGSPRAVGALRGAQQPDSRFSGSHCVSPSALLLGEEGQAACF